MVDFGTSFNFYQFLTPSNITSKMGGEGLDQLKLKTFCKI